MTKIKLLSKEERRQRRGLGWACVALAFSAVIVLTELIHEFNED
ncbi:hypothetical protein ACVR1G_06860 [Streptococcus dentasini]